MQSNLTREQALALLKEYNKEPFHIQHALTVEGTLRWYANDLGYGDDADFWAIAGLLHDIDFENWPEEHCVKAPELLRPAGVGEDMIHAIVSHAYGLCSDVEPEHEMEKVLFAVDELTGLIGAAALMRPSKSVMDMEVSSSKRNSRTRSSPPAAPATSSSRARNALAGNCLFCLKKPLPPCRAARNSSATK